MQEKILAAEIDYTVDRTWMGHGVAMDWQFAAPPSDTERRIIFQPKHGGSFRFWRLLNGPADSDHRGEFHDIVPAYHPQHPANAAFHLTHLVDGRTDRTVARDVLGITHIICPADAHITAGPLTSSWTRVNHPYYAQGRTFEIILHLEQCNRRTWPYLRRLLGAALGMNSSYVGVSGGFHSPYRTLTRPLAGDQSTKEENVLWQYLTLVEEGMFRGCAVPPWFHHIDWREMNTLVRLRTPELARNLSSPLPSP